MSNEKDFIQPTIHPYDYEQASNAYLMSLVAVIAGLPLPIVNVIASVIFYSAKRKAPYIVRWHALQSLLGQILIMPFNSVAFWWTFRIIFANFSITTGHFDIDENFETFSSPAYWAYILFTILLNLFEFIAVIITATQVSKGQNVRWFGIASLTDALCSKENRDPYSI